MTENDDNTLDPAAVLRGAIEAAQKSSASPIEGPSKMAENSGVESNVHAHPALLRDTRAATQNYFVTDEPMVRRCDPAFGVGFVFT